MSKRDPECKMADVKKLVCMHRLLLKRKVTSRIQLRLEDDEMHKRRRSSRQKLEFVFLMLVAICSSYHVERTVWMQNRSSHFWNFIVKRTFTMHDWYENF